ncbi:ParB/RepB/Spo0J family partition protein [Sabulicella rubraurantiaca]|uniref:ParB/RepB/Spo0J family partition protein n=1 Tax=Sabulicella rubraurantiaca TaxID=2811429 RepID=UPI001A96E611|nr:ParB/RepB/Spo0J family partition protein [Sabulicella rubraurantiaca]
MAKPAPKPKTRMTMAAAMAQAESDPSLGLSDVNAFTGSQPFAPLDAAEQRGQSMQDRLNERDAIIASLREELAARSATSERPANAAELEKMEQNLRRYEAEMETLRALANKAQQEGDITEFVFLDPSQIEDTFPADRFDSAFNDEAIQRLTADIAARGQDSPILVRPKPGAPEGTVYEIAAGKRRLAACRTLGRTVLARVRVLSNEEMLTARFGENHHRQDLSALERAMFYQNSLAMMRITAKELGDLYGVDQSLIRHVLRLNRIPAAIVQAFRRPQDISIKAGLDLVVALDKNQSPHTEARVIRALQEFHRQIDNGTAHDLTMEVRVAQAAARGVSPVLKPSSRQQALPIFMGNKQIAGATQRGGRWNIAFTADVDDTLMEALLQRLPDLLAEIQPEKKRA